VLRPPPRFSVVPSACLIRHDVPYHLRCAYATLYALAWRNGYRSLTCTLEDLAGYWSDVEGGDLSVAAARKRLEAMAAYGMIARQRRGPKAAKTVFLWRHEDSPGSPPQGEGEETTHTPHALLAQAADHPPAATVDHSPTEDAEQPAASGLMAQKSATPSSNHLQKSATPSSSHLQKSATSSVAVISSSSQKSATSSVAVIASNNINNISGGGGNDSVDSPPPPPLILLLTGFGVHQDVAESLAERGVTVEEAQAWIAYARRERSVQHPPGFVVSKLGRHISPPAPSLTQEERHRQALEQIWHEYQRRQAEEEEDSEWENDE